MVIYEWNVSTVCLMDELGKIKIRKNFSFSDPISLFNFSIFVDEKKIGTLLLGEKIFELPVGNHIIHVTSASRHSEKAIFHIDADQCLEFKTGAFGTGLYNPFVLFIILPILFFLGSYMRKHGLSIINWFVLIVLFIVLRRGNSTAIKLYIHETALKSSSSLN